MREERKAGKGVGVSHPRIGKIVDRSVARVPSARRLRIRVGRISRACVRACDRSVSPVVRRTSQTVVRRNTSRDLGTALAQRRNGRSESTEESHRGVYSPPSSRDYQNGGCTTRVMCRQISARIVIVSGRREERERYHARPTAWATQRASTARRR